MDCYPNTVRAYLSSTYGTPIRTERLSGLSKAQVWRLHFTHQTLIIKQTARLHELAFYQVVAPVLQEQGVTLPSLEWSTINADTACLILEDIPIPFPKTRWYADKEQLALLHRLHGSTLPSSVRLPALFQPQWTEDMSQYALTYFPTLLQEQLGPLLESLRMVTQPLFMPTCFISGDPNPTNWGLRHNATIVLFDWERFGHGTPALDLAITIAGLPTIDVAYTVAHTYLGNAEQMIVKQLAQEIILAKVWNIVEFLSMFPDRSAPSDTIAYLTCELPRWLTHVSTVYEKTGI